MVGQTLDNHGDRRLHHVPVAHNFPTTINDLFLVKHQRLPYDELLSLVSKYQGAINRNWYQLGGVLAQLSTLPKHEYRSILIDYEISTNTATALIELYMKFFLMRIVPPRPTVLGYKKLHLVIKILRLDNYDRLIAMCRKLTYRDMRSKLARREIYS